MAVERQEGGAAAGGEPSWVAILLALIALLGFLLTQTGLPQTALGIGLVDTIFVALVAVLIYRIENQFDAKGCWTLLGRTPLALCLAALTFGTIAGVLAELASSADPPAPRGFVDYEKQLGEVLGPLRRASGSAFEAPESRTEPNAYAENARELGQGYADASEVLDGIEPPRPGDQALHSRLVVRLGAVGEAYVSLGDLVAGGAGKPKVEAARAEVQASIGELRTVEEVLQRRDYRIALTG